MKVIHKTNSMEWNNMKFIDDGKLAYIRWSYNIWNCNIIDTKTFKDDVIIP